MRRRGCDEDNIIDDLLDDSRPVDGSIPVRSTPTTPAREGQPFRALQGPTYRISFIWWPGLEEGKPDLTATAPRFIGAPTNFIGGVGYVVNKGPEFTKLAGGELPRTRIATIIIVWPTDEGGSVDIVRLAAGDVDVLPWVISSDKYKSLEHMNKEWPLSSHDIILSCSDATYQKLTFTPCRDSLLLALLDHPKATLQMDAVIAKAQAIANGIRDHVGREMTVEQVQARIAARGPPLPKSNICRERVAG